MRTSVLISILLMSILIPGAFAKAENIVPDDFYKSGFPKSSGRYEEGVTGKADIDFCYQTDYYGTPYDLLATFPFENVDPCEITKVTINGQQVENFTVFNNYIYSRFNQANGVDDMVIAIQSDWEFDTSYTVHAYGRTPDDVVYGLKVSTKSPIRDVEYHYPDEICDTRYVLVNLSNNELDWLNINEVFINELPVKDFTVTDNKLLLPVAWTSPSTLPEIMNGRYNVKLVGVREGQTATAEFKVIGPRMSTGFGYPSKDFPYYSMRYTFLKDEFEPFQVKEVLVNDEEVRDFIMTDDGESKWDKKITGNANLSMKVRCDWEKGKTYTLEVNGITEDGSTVNLKTTGTAESGWGYWDKNWKHYATVVLEETDGIKREQEPVHIKLALYADRLTDPDREIRVIEYDRFRINTPEGPYREVPSQIYNISTFDDRELIDSVETDEASGERIVRYLATTTLEVAFFADVEKYTSKIYLIFYGNPDAGMPSYHTDLNISSPEIGQTVKNDMYEIGLSENSGAFFTILLKQGKDVILEHKLETNGAIHWNPGAYSPPHSWVHASDWQNPNFEQISGPIFHMTKRYAPLPHMDDIFVSITYVFYAGKPYVVTTSITELKEEHFVKTIRNGEIVFNHVELNEFVYKSPMGNIDGFMIEGSRLHPEHAIHVPYDVPWLAFINRDKKIGFGGITIELANTNLYGGLSDAEMPYFYVANGPWIYWSRALNYSFGSNNTSRMIRAKKGSFYYEKTAYMPFVLGESPSDEFRMLEEVSEMLRNPLRVSYYLDTDNRNNKGWVVPILVEPFDEGVEGAVGGST